MRGVMVLHTLPFLILRAEWGDLNNARPLTHLGEEMCSSQDVLEPGIGASWRCWRICFERYRTRTSS